MKRFAGMTLLFCVIAVSSYAVDDHQPQLPESASPERQRAVSREGVEYLERLRKGTPFGTTEFNLQSLRAGMGARNEPKIEGVRLIRAMIGDIPEYGRIKKIQHLACDASISAAINRLTHWLHLLVLSDQYAWRLAVRHQKTGDVKLLANPFFKKFQRSLPL